MGSEDNAEIGEILEKVDTLSEELASIRKDLDVLNSMPEIIEKIESIGSEIDEVKSSLEPLAKIDDIESSLDEVKIAIDDMKESKDFEELTEKVDGLNSSMNDVSETIHEVNESKETEVIIKKIDDILIGTSEIEVISKKLDDLQGYIAGLSGIEEKVEDLSSAFQETQEIVGIIVRQLDDIERKYNLSIDKINETADLVTKIAEDAAAPQLKSLEKKSAKNTESESLREPEKKASISKANLPSTIDAIMDRLVGLVNPQTEATDMAEALEDVRDQLTSMIQGTTPVLFQFGKKARELKSYPPTATLNENDIASLNKDIKSWSSKLKEIAKNS
jgi:DNA repair exonuclease SbcCD ATPase subunit